MKNLVNQIENFLVSQGFYKIESVVVEDEAQIYFNRGKIEYHISLEGNSDIYIEYLNSEGVEYQCLVDYYGVLGKIIQII